MRFFLRRGVGHGAVEVVVELLERGDERGVVDGLVLGGESFAGAEFFEVDVDVGEAEAVRGLRALAVLLLLGAVGEGEWIEAAGFGVARPIFEHSAGGGLGARTKRGRGVVAGVRGAHACEDARVALRGSAAQRSTGGVRRLVGDRVRARRLKAMTRAAGPASAGPTHTRKIAPSFLPSRIVMPAIVMPRNAIAQTPRAEAMNLPSPSSWKSS